MKKYSKGYLKKAWISAVLAMASTAYSGVSIADNNKDKDHEFNNLSLTFSIASRHIQQRQFRTWENPNIKRDFNEINPGLILNYKLDSISASKFDISVSTGTYKNSFYETTYLASTTIETKSSKFMGRKIDFGVELGLTHGYKDPTGKKFPVLPMGQVFFSIEAAKNIDFRVGFIPMTAIKSLLPDKSMAVDVVTASVVWRPKR